MGTSFAVDFVVFDQHTPAASSSVTRTVTVVSPCQASELFCHGRLPACASNLPCDLRAEGVADEELPHVSLETDVSAFPSGAVRLSSTSVLVHSVCGYPPPVQLDTCSPLDDSTDSGNSQAACVFSAPDPTQVYTISSEACTPASVLSGDCHLCAIDTMRLGTCGTGTYQYSVVLVSAQSSAASLTVLIAPLVATLNFTATTGSDLSVSDLSVLLGGSAVSTAATELHTAFLNQMLASGSCTPDGISQDDVSDVLVLHTEIASVTQAPDHVSLGVHIAVGLPITEEDDATSARVAVEALLPECLPEALGTGLDVLQGTAGSPLAGHVLTVDSSSVTAQAAACHELSEEELLNNWLIATEAALTDSMTLTVAAVSEVCSKPV